MGLEGRDHNSPPKPVLPPRAHQGFKGSHPSPKNPEQRDGSLTGEEAGTRGMVPSSLGVGSKPRALQLPLPAALSAHNPVAAPSAFPPWHSPLLLLSQAPPLIIPNLPPQASASIPQAPHLSRLSTSTYPSLPGAPWPLPLWSLPITSSPLGCHPPGKPGPPWCPPVWSSWPGPVLPAFPLLSFPLPSPLSTPQAQFLADVSPADPSEHNSSPFPLEEHCFQPLGLAEAGDPPLQSLPHKPSGCTSFLPHSFFSDHPSHPPPFTPARGQCPSTGSLLSPTPPAA